MFGYLLFLVVSYSALFTVVTIEQCKPDGYDDCYVFRGDPGEAVLVIVDIKNKTENVSSVVESM